MRFFFAPLFFILFLVSFAVPAQAAIANGMLVRADGGTRIYYIDHGVRRWVDSPNTLEVKGLSFTPVVIVSETELAIYPEGDRLTQDSIITFPTKETNLPDLAPYPMEDLRLSTLHGRTILRFTSTFLNQGKTFFELIGSSRIETNGYQKTFQRIAGQLGQIWMKIVGDFLYHPAHHHYHFSDFADYIFALERPYSTQKTSTPIVVQKTTFCLYDTVAGNLSLPGALRTRAFTTCGRFRQGLSIGWTDQYLHSLPDQYIDIQDHPAGIYRLSFSVDPRGHFVEERSDNNRSDVFVELNPAAKTMRVVAAFAPFKTVENLYPDGMLIRANDDHRVYVLEKGHKRWLQTEEVLKSYGYSIGTVFTLSKSLVDTVPNARLIRLDGTGSIFTINDQGYKRKILSPEVIASYGSNLSNLIDVNQTEFNAYKDTDLINPMSRDQVFSISQQVYVGTLLDLTDDQRASVHQVNETDLLSYASRVVATGLNVPWDVAFLPDGDMMVTERPGTLKRMGKHPATFTVPHVYGAGEGGLMGIAVHPEFIENNFIYLYFTSDEKINRVTRFRLTDNQLLEDKIIIDKIPSSIYHDGGQIAFGPDGMLYLTTGDAQQENLAPALSSLAGKVLRINDDGSIPSDNPFGTAVWSYGHRNPQGIAWDGLGRLWATEHGRTSGILSGFDELNLIEKGKNYGWPASQGDSVASGTIGPVKHSTANVTWAPSGLAYTDDRLFFSGLKGESLYLAELNSSGSLVRFDSLFKNTFGRLRAATIGPDGFLYITTSNRDGRGTPRALDDKIIRITPGFLK